MSANKFQPLVNAEENFLASLSTRRTINKKVSKPKCEKLAESVPINGTSTVITTAQNNTKLNKNVICDKSSDISNQSAHLPLIQAQISQPNDSQNSKADNLNLKRIDDFAEQIVAVANDKQNNKSKKSGKCTSAKRNEITRSSNNNCDVIQKRNLIHVRSSDASKAPAKFNNNQEGHQTNCKYCDKPVYKMEEVKAEGQVYHKTCFRCNECAKQLKVGNYQRHEGVLYCLVHFKLLFAPKYVKDNDTEKAPKPELIIRENQPAELPPDVIRASDKPNLGLEELQQLNVRSRFHIFEKVNNTDNDEHVNVRKNSDGLILKRSASIMSKITELQQQISREIDEDFTNVDEDMENDVHDEVNESDIIDENLICYENRRNTRSNSGGAISDLRSRFELGNSMSKEERREERKQEIQNIRSRLFMGKQARIKEMYQQAVVESENGKVSSSSKSEIPISIDARSLRDRFEKGEILNDETMDEACNYTQPKKQGMIHQEADVFESAMSKQSRSIFLELDANAAAIKKGTDAPSHQTISKRASFKTTGPERDQSTSTSNMNQSKIDVVKCTEQPEEIVVQTSEISEKFKFFEKYHPVEHEKVAFRITPPRDGVVKIPSPEMEGEIDSSKPALSETRDLERSHTTALMINKFRELENGLQTNSHRGEFRPLKCFTPPIDGRRKWDPESDYDTDDDVDSGSDEDSDGSIEDETNHILYLDDEALREAQTAARAKQLRAKFEKWQANEIERELTDGHINAYSTFVSDDTTIEGTKVIRERFEKLKNGESNQPIRPRYQVNRFLYIARR
uniref:LIM zinc-binding domain-containing protein n=1 Tax=Glossina brevipalpis TaxID=37001 RepID=A0A1A9WQC6_9MUSC